jgi:hypothetical protein
VLGYSPSVHSGKRKILLLLGTENIIQPSTFELKRGYVVTIKLPVTYASFALTMF